MQTMCKMMLSNFFAKSFNKFQNYLKKKLCKHMEFIKSMNKYEKRV